MLRALIGMITWPPGATKINLLHGWHTEHLSLSPSVDDKHGAEKQSATRSNGRPLVCNSREAPKWTGVGVGTFSEPRLGEILFSYYKVGIQNDDKGNNSSRSLSEKAYRPELKVLRQHSELFLYHM